MNSAAASAAERTPAAFDAAAPEYDRLFEANPLARPLRRLTWRTLATLFPAGTRVLELGCGTGTDALFLAARGTEVTATDASRAMLDSAASKAASAGLTGRIRFFPLPFEGLAGLAGGPFDGAYSNFGAINCASDAGAVARDLHALLRPGAPIMLCVMSRTCLWETAAFLLRGNVQSAFRRRRSGLAARIGRETMPVVYFSPGRLARLISPWFGEPRVYGLSIFSPPPPAARFAEAHPFSTRALQKIDDLVRALPPVRGWGDHFVLTARRREP